MTRAEFLARLKRGLAGLPVSAAAEILSDYEAHFDDAASAGRSEAEVAEALGDPDRLARELKAEAGMQRWREEKNPSAAVAAVFAVIGLGAIDIIILLPLLTGVVSALAGLFLAAIGVFIAGGAVLVAGPFFSPPGGPLFAVLLGLGMMGLAVFGAAILAVLTVWLVNGLVWFARLHYRLLKPALDSTTTPQASDPTQGEKA